MERIMNISKFENEGLKRPGQEQDTYQSSPSQENIKVEVDVDYRLAQEKAVSEVLVSQTAKQQQSANYKQTAKLLLVEQRNNHNDESIGSDKEPPADIDAENKTKIHNDGNNEKCNEKSATTDVKDTSMLASSKTINANTTGQAPSSCPKYVCSYCKLPLASRQSLHRHKKNKHGNEIREEPAKAIIQCYKCKTLCCSTMKELIGHLNSRHGHSFQIQQAEFASGKEFQKWKLDLEKSYRTLFVKMSGSSNFRDHVTSYYYCNRSGKYETKGTGKRALKSKGSSKIAGRCSAFLNSTTYKNTGKIIVEYCVDHLHGIEIGHLKMSEELRSFILGKLSNGVDSKVLLDEIHENMSKLDGRDKLITHKDILNIKNQYIVSMANKNSDDSGCAKIWMNNLPAQDYDPIVIFKEQGIEQFGLHKNCFLLGIQTEFQRDIMLKYGPSAICIDSFRKTTQYDFLITTVAVVDDYGEAIPVAWLISNQDDEPVLVPFFEALKQRVGDIKCKVFRSNLANNFYNAWCHVFKRPFQRLYFTWHTKKNWNRNILLKVKGDKAQKEVNGMLDIFLYEPDENEFRKLLAEVVTRLEKLAPEFHKYFVNSYVVGNKIKLWATCFRKGAIINANMYVEALNRVLKCIYFKRKQNRRVDELLVALLKMDSYKGYTRLIELEKERVVNKVKETGERHQSGAELDLTEVKKAAAENIKDLLKTIESSQDVNAIQCSLKYIKGAVATIKGLAFVLTDKDFEKKDNFMCKNRFEPQTRFYSIKQQKKGPSVSKFSRLTVKEKGGPRKKLKKM